MGNRLLPGKHATTCTYRNVLGSVFTHAHAETSVRGYVGLCGCMCGVGACVGWVHVCVP